ncbi:SAGA complex subunit spt20 [Hyphodiscus hymeniophilus]|uniref:SAGA complex subunit spt20 n=1 Tax=Hyphodiscus hymeniophilus TaxID=353542 RepID=A0A9P7AX92_9HELO|nr:SAGA complex subunit spt20 [Hyphodiscus hymeniophilus]
MAPISQPVSSKVKRPPGIITNGIHSSTSSPSPSMSASRLPGGSAKYPPNSATSNGAGSSSNARSANRMRRDAPGHLLGRGQRNGSVGLRSASIVGDLAVQQAPDPPPYIKTDDYILKRYRANRPSLVVHLHPTHFRFDQQEGSFGYKSPMRLLLEHLRLRTIPHDLMEFFTQNNIEFFEGCMIIQVVDHKSVAPAQESIRTNSTTTKNLPFSVHNHNPCLTPSPWAPYPIDNGLPGKGKASSEADGEDAGKLKTSEQKDKENMPAPAFPADGRGKSVAQPKKPKTFTIVLHPTPVSDHAEFISKAASSRLANVSDSRQDTSGALSATVPPTPSTAVPSTPQMSMAPPAKRIKRSKMELDSTTHHALASQLLLATTAPLVLDPVNSVSEAAALLESLAHPMHAGKPPSPKTRKRTVAEMAADEEFAAAQERYMLVFDEKNAAAAQGGANTADGDGQSGGASFEPRFERFNVIENIRNQHEENKKSEKARQQEAERKNLQDRERERLRLESEKKLEQERLRNIQIQQAAAQRNLAQQQEVQRRAMAQGAQQSQPGMQAIPPQHAHPQPNIANGMQGQPQRFHQQQASQAQISSPIVRNGTPQNHSSPMNNMGNIPMQHSTSSMGGSPPRPGSVVNPQMGGPTSHVMTAQRSQQSHAGTPRMHSATPNIQSTPLNRQMSATPRMSQASPLNGQMAQTPQMPQQMMNNGQMMNLNSAQQNTLQLQQQQAIMAQRMQRQREAAALAQSIQMQNGGQTLTPQQQMMQAQLVRAQQQQAQQAQGGNMPQLAQNYQQQLAQMAQQSGNMPQNMNFNAQGMSPMQIQAMQMQRMQQMQQAQANAQAQAQAHAQNQHQPQMNPQAAQQAQQNQMLAKSIQNAAQNLYQQHFPTLQAQYPNGVPEEAMRNLRAQCQQQATQQVHSTFRARRQMQQHQQMLVAQQGGMNPNGMNGMGMQRPNGM